MTNFDPRPPDGVYPTDSPFGYRDETAERRSRAVAVSVIVVAVLLLLAMLVWKPVS
jgi:hypothetical protein